MEGSNKMLSVCKQLFETWNQKGVRYCHWKSNEHLLEGLLGETDLDVYVFPEDKNIAEKQLKESLYIKFVPQKSSRYPMVDEWIGFDPETGKLVHVHLHYQIITGTKFCKEYVFPIDEEIIETRVLDEETKVYLASPEIEIIVLFARIVLKSTNKQNITTSGYDDEISYLKQRINKDVLKYKCETIIGKEGSRYYELILSKLSKQEWKELKAIIYTWLDKHRKMSRIKAFLRTRYYWVKLYKDLFDVKYLNKAVISKKTFSDANISLCFLGQDGSGKSTLSIDVEKWLRWKIEAHRFYLGSGEHYNSLVKKILSKATTLRKGYKTVESSIEIKQKGNIQTKKKKSLVSIVVAFMTAYDLKNVAKRAYREIRKAANYSHQGAVSLFDRFPQNQFKGIYDGPKIRSIYVENGYDYWFFKRMAYAEEKFIDKIQKYQPSVVFKLLLSPEESIKRKPFENYEQICQKHQITEKITFKDSEVHEIDATQDYSEELLLVKKIIWSYFLKKQ